LLKHQLIDEVFDICDSADLEKIKDARGKILAYQKNHEEDPQISDLLILIEILTTENEDGNYEASYELAEPIFNRLSRTKEWDYCDVRFFASLVDCCSLNFDHIDDQAETALRKLEDYSDNKKYSQTKSTIHMNVLFRLLRTKYLERIDMQNKALVKRLENTFLNTL